MNRVVLVHAAGMNQAMWEPQRSLWPADLEVVAVDLPGHGTRCADPFTLASACEVLEAALTTPSFVVGSALGGYVAALTAGTAPAKVRGLVLVGCLPQMPDSTVLQLSFGAELLLSKVPGIGARLVERVLAGSAGAALTSTIIDAGVRPSARAEAGRELLDLDIRQPLEAYGGRLLLVNGSEDAAARLHADELATYTPHADAITVHDAGHMVSWDQPAEFARLVTTFCTTP